MSAVGRARATAAALALATALPGGLARAADETVVEALCRVVDAAARSRDLPVTFLTRLIWQESSFRSDVVSRAGAQGIAQFMPGTARERGLADPFDPEQAIPAAAGLVADLRARFGNLGLAAAAYNGGPTRVASWLAGTGGLPDETRSYVARITGRLADEWAADARTASSAAASSASAKLPSPAAPVQGPELGCLQVTADLRRSGFGFTSEIASGATAPWGVQLAGNFSKALALASFERGRARYAALLGDAPPMVIGTRLRNRGTRAFYRVRLPAQTRGEANALCGRIHGRGGACVVLRS